MSTHRLYYQLKPFIPRRLQIEIRRQIVRRKREKYAHIWPIDEKAGKPPEGWTGWPDGKKFALVLMHDVDTEKGHEKCLELARLDQKMGFHSSFNFVPERYRVSPEVRRILVEKGFEVGVHGLKHDGMLFSSRKRFEEGAVRINQYLKDWQSVGFVSPSMHRNLDWIHDLNVQYDASTFDTDPFEPQPDGVGTIFPFWVPTTPNSQHSTLNTELKDSRLNTQHLALNTDSALLQPTTSNLPPPTVNHFPRPPSSTLQPPTVSVESLPPTSNLSPPTASASGYVELPYTLPQDFTLFVIMGEKNIDIWKKKLDMIADHGGMALLITHPDYMNSDHAHSNIEEYPTRYYEELLSYIKQKYQGQYWNALPKEMAKFWIECNQAEDNNSRSKERNGLGEKDQIAEGSKKQTIWIDLDNSPHVPFFSPIIAQLEGLGYKVLLTARDCSQTCGLADLFNMNYRRIGRHYGKNRFAKVIGTIYRGLQLVLRLAGQKPDFAISHGSRAQMIAARLLRIPSLTMMDYEYVKGFIRPTWIMAPEVVSKGLSRHGQKNNLTYPGIKEDVYVPSFVPDLNFKNRIGINGKDILITIRPPATEAHYHNPRSEDLFKESVNFLSKNRNVCMVLLPRNERQKEYIQREWPGLIKERKLIIPGHVVGGLNLMWYSDLVISGGGTMNREAAALGVPVYSIFSGKIGAVDRYLSDTGRLVLLESTEDIRTKISLTKRVIPDNFEHRSNTTLNSIIDSITRLIENQQAAKKAFLNR